MIQAECIFCKIIQGLIPCEIVAQSEHVLVIRDIHPKAPTHYLILSKKHIPSIADLGQDADVVGGAVIAMAHKLAQNVPNRAFNLVVNNGAAAGQSVFHLHVHFLAGKNVYQDGGLTL